MTRGEWIGCTFMFVLFFGSIAMALVLARVMPAEEVDRDA